VPPRLLNGQSLEERLAHGMVIKTSGRVLGNHASNPLRR
jgi:hypothetical protein